MKVSLRVAEAKLSELIDAAVAGEDVVIDRDDSTAVKIVPVESAKSFKFGLLVGKVSMVPDFFEPMTEDELKLWEGAA